MASQALGEIISCHEIHSYIRGYHVYKDNWIPAIGQVLLLKREPENAHNRNSVSVTTSCGEIVGHVPYNLAPILSQFLRRDINKGSTEMSGERINRGGGYGLEIPRLYGPQHFIECLGALIKELWEKSLI